MGWEGSLSSQEHNLVSENCAATTQSGPSKQTTSRVLQGSSVGIFRTAKQHQRSSRSQNPGQVVAVLGWVGQLVHHDKYLQRETRKHNLFMSLVVDSGSCFFNILMLR